MSTKQKEKNESSHLGDASEMKGKPFDGLKLASHEVLERAQMTGRSKCPKCNGSRMFYCYTCFSLVGVNQDDVPKIKVSMKMNFTNERQNRMRSTSKFAVNCIILSEISLIFIIYIESWRVFK